MIISAMNLKGGVGKTTTAMSLAPAAARAGPAAAAPALLGASC